MRVQGNAATVFGGMIAEALDDIAQAEAKLKRAHAAMDAARDAPPNHALIEGGDFGWAEGQGADAFTLVSSIKASYDTFLTATATWRARIDMGG